MTDRFWSGRSALITGINGFLGAWLARTLLERGARVVGFDTAATGALALHEGLAEKVDVVIGNVLALDDVTRAFEQYRPETCFHLAGASHVDRSIAMPVDTFEVNTRGTWVVLEAARRAAPLAGLLVASSNHVYGNHSVFPYTEDFALNGSSPYAASKACADVVARSYASTYGMPIVLARLTNTYGGADPHLTHIVTATVLAVLRGEAPVIHSDGTPLKSYLYVCDTVDGLIRLAEGAAAPDVRGRAFNLCMDEPIRVLDLVRTILAVAGAAERGITVLGKPSESCDCEFLSNQRARAIVGWAPQYTLDAGLRETMAWYRERPWATARPSNSISPH